MNTKSLNLPYCFNEIKKINVNDLEGVVYGLYSAHGYSFQDVKNTFVISGRKILSSLNLDEELLLNSSIITCDNIRQKYDIDKDLCAVCDFNSERLKSKAGIPMQVRESMILNLAQQNKQILQAINPEKLVSLSEICGMYVKIYKEFYCYLKKENVTEDKNILGILKRIFSINEEIPVKIKDVDMLLDYLYEDKIHKIRTLNKNIQQPIKIVHPTDVRLQQLNTANYIALNFRTAGNVIIYSENSSTVYNLCLNDDIVGFLNNILINSAVKAIVKDIETINIIRQYKLRVRNLVPMNIVFNSLNLKKDKTDFENLVNEFINIEDKVDKKLLSFTTFLQNTDCEISIENANYDFYKVKALDRDDKLLTIEFDIQYTLENVHNRNLSFKEFYCNIADIINNYTYSYKYVDKIKFNILEISEKLILSTKKENKKYVVELIFIAAEEILFKVSPSATFSVKYK